MSPILIPFLPVLSIYVGPIPLRVEPILDFPFESSEAASKSLWVGKIICAFLEIHNDFLKLILNGSGFSISFSNITGSITTPLPIKFIDFS